jgi:hypothetical protein
MSLHVAAKHLASKGRDGDSMLVHMSPGEVKGLQGLALAHGGSLSINPNTGLVEASFLKRILPMVAGAALTGLSGGVINPLTASMIVGGGTAVATGDISKGLMAGLGAYGGAGFSQGLAGAAGSAATETAAANALGVPASAMPVDMVTGLPTAVGTGATSQAGMLAAENAAMGLTPAQSVANISSSAGYAAGAAPASMFDTGSSLLRAGAERILDNPREGVKAAYNAMPTGTLPALGATVADAMTPEAAPIPGMPEEDPMYAGAPYRYRLASNFSGYVPRQPTPYYRPTGLGYAEGGDIAMAAGGSYEDEPMGDNPGMAAGGIAGYAAGGLKMKTMSPGEGIARDTDEDTASLGAYDAAKKRVEKQFAAANLKSSAMPKTNVAKLGQMKAMAEGGLGSYSDGGRMLKGPGDGMSDDIPAMIGKKQPARLADGEFVVPADVVSHLGNGSTDAGAKKLYAMMDKVRTARTGKKKQAPAVKGDKYLPKFADGGSVAPTAPTAPTAVSAPATAPTFSYPGSGMSLADITSLGNLIARGNAEPMQAAMPAPMPASTQAPTQAPMPTDMGLSAKLAAAQTNRPIVTSTPLPKSMVSEYANLRPDMLIDPAAAGWTKAEYLGGFGWFRNKGGTSSIPEGAQTYVDPNGNTWFRT